MAINPLKLLQLQEAWTQFKKNHPKFPLFLTAVSKHGIREGSVMEIKVTTPEGREITANLKLTPSDMELIEQLKEMMR